MERHERQLVESPDRRFVVTVACSCGWRSQLEVSRAYHDFDEHLKSVGLCPRCRNRGTYVVETGSSLRYRKLCACKHGRALRQGR